MPTISVFIGGTGVRSAVILRGRSRFYKYDVGPLRAVDTEPHQHGEARAVLKQDLLVAEDGFAADLQQAAEQIRVTPPIGMYQGTNPLGFGVVRAGADTVLRYLTAGAGLYTLRSAGWLAMDDILQDSPNFIPQLANAVTNAIASSGGQGVVVHVIGSVAGGTGSGLFLPLISRLQQQLGNQNAAHYETHLTIVLASAFERDWQGAPDSITRRTRGHSGSYAAIRELQYLTARPDPNVQPERRAIHGNLPRPHIDRIHWFGRRALDADVSSAETFNEVGRVLALLADDRFESAVRPVAGANPFTQLPSFNSLEYPKYEMAQRLAAQATVSMLDRILSEEDGGGQPVLRMLEGQRPPLLTFVAESRQSPQILATEASAKDNRVPQATMVGPQSLMAACGVTNTMAAAPKGNDLHQPSYNAPTGHAWNEYCANLFQQRESLEAQHINDTRNVLRTQQDQATSYVVEAMGQAVQTATDAQSGLPLVNLARRRILNLVRDIDVARIFFDRTPVDCVIAPTGTARRLAPSEQQKAVVESLRARMTGDLRPVPPKGWQYSPIISGLIFLVAMLALVGYILRLVPPLFEFPSWFDESTSDITNLQLLAAFLVTIALFALHRWWVGRSWKQLPQVRREAEADLIRAWEWYVTCRQAEMLWDSARNLCQNLVGSTGDRATPGVASPPTQVGRCLNLLWKGLSWLAELRNMEQARLAAAQGPRRTSVHEVRPDPAFLKLEDFWPAVNMESRSGIFGGVGALTDFRIGPPGDTMNALSVQSWEPTGPGAAATPQTRQAIQNRGNGFLAAIEEVIRQKVVDAAILPDSLEDVIRNDPEYDSPEALANRLEELASTAQQRGASATLVPAPFEATSHLVVPNQQIAARVHEATEHARQHASQYPALNNVLQSTGNVITESPNVDQAIALVQFRRFAWPGAQGPQLEAIDHGKRFHYAINGDPHGNPQQTEQYSAYNTEFYLLPEQSAAAAIEVKSGIHDPLPMVLQHRLYGSHLDVREVPSLIDLFYLADTRGMFLDLPGGAGAWTTTGIPVPTLEWYLVDERQVDVNSDAAIRAQGLPLVTYATVGDAVNDELGNARARMILFDAFLTAMSYRGAGIGDNAVPVFLVKQARVLSATWPQPAAYQRLDGLRAGLVQDWFRLGATNGRPTYEQMRRRAQEDAHLMPQHLGQAWEVICLTQFEQSMRNLGLQA